MSELHQIAHYDPKHPPKTLDAALRLLEEIEKLRPRAVTMTCHTGAKPSRFCGVDFIEHGRKYCEVEIEMADGRYYILEGAECKVAFKPSKHSFDSAQMHGGSE